MHLPRLSDSALDFHRKYNAMDWRLLEEFVDKFVG